MTQPRLCLKCGCGAAPSVTKLDSGAFVFVASDATPDCEGDVFVPAGAKLERFNQNPIVYLSHDVQKPVARGRAYLQRGRVMAEVRFPEPGADALADQVRQKVEAGLISAMSIGAIVLDWEALESGGRLVRSWELYELSIVPIPCNRNTVRVKAKRQAPAPEAKGVTREELAAAVRRGIHDAIPASPAVLELAVKSGMREAAIDALLQQTGALDQEALFAKARREPALREAVAKVLLDVDEKSAAMAGAIVSRFSP